MGKAEAKKYKEVQIETKGTQNALSELDRIKEIVLGKDRKEFNFALANLQKEFENQNKLFTKALEDQKKFFSDKLEQLTKMVNEQSESTVKHFNKEIENHKEVWLQTNEEIKSNYSKLVEDVTNNLHTVEDNLSQKQNQLFGDLQNNKVSNSQFNATNETLAYSLKELSEALLNNKITQD